MAGIGAGLVNVPLASTAVAVVEPARAGMASGVNSTFRQVGIATGVAALGAILAHAAPSTGRGPEAAQGFVDGLNDILLVGAVLAFAAAGGVAGADPPARLRAPHGGGAGPGLEGRDHVGAVAVERRLLRVVHEVDVELVTPSDSSSRSFATWSSAVPSTQKRSTISSGTNSVSRVAGAPVVAVVVALAGADVVGQRLGISPSSP